MNSDNYANYRADDLRGVVSFRSDVDLGGVTNESFKSFLVLLLNCILTSNSNLLYNVRKR